MVKSEATQEKWARGQRIAQNKLTRPGMVQSENPTATRGLLSQEEHLYVFKGNAVLGI